MIGAVLVIVGGVVLVALAHALTVPGDADEEAPMVRSFREHWQARAQQEKREQ